MKILIDADGCPVVKQTIEIAKENKIEVMVFCDTSHIINSDYAKIVTVSKGADSYEVDGNKAEYRLFKIVNSITEKGKPLIFHECGLIPTVEDLERVPWCSFMTWHTEWLIDTNSKEHLNEIYNSDYVITLDELPSFS